MAETATGIRVVRWTAGRFAFAVTIEGVDEDTFRHMVKNFVAVADRFSHKYRNFKLNYKRKTGEKPAEEKPAEETTQAKNETPAS